MRHERGAIAQAWRRFLYANLLADEEVMADTIIQRFAADDSIGLVFPDDPHIIGWGENLPYALELAKRIGIAPRYPKPPSTFQSAPCSGRGPLR